MFYPVLFCFALGLFGGGGGGVWGVGLELAISKNKAGGKTSSNFDYVTGC